MSADAFRRSIKEPIPDIFQAVEHLSRAADAHIAGNTVLAEAMFCEADIPEIWNWLYPEWDNFRLNLRITAPDNDTSWVSPAERDPVKYVRTDPRAAPVRAAVLARDGFRCRYCGIPVISADIAEIADDHYPSAVPWRGRKAEDRHKAFLGLWLQYDHVVPHSHGGRSSTHNVVISCALCNYGKFDLTLKQLAVSDPRLRLPEPLEWDGLERLRVFKLPRRLRRPAPAAAPHVAKLPVRGRFFVPGSSIRGGFLKTPALGGKPRWFELADDVTAGPAIRDGIEGCWLQCDPALFRRRGLRPDDFLDPEHAAPPIS